MSRLESEVFPIDGGRSIDDDIQSRAQVLERGFCHAGDHHCRRSGGLGDGVVQNDGGLSFTRRTGRVGGIELGPVDGALGSAVTKVADLGFATMDLAAMEGSSMDAAGRRRDRCSCESEEDGARKH